MTFEITTNLKACDGAPIPLRIALAEQPAAKQPVRGVVHINHGLSEHSGRYHRFAQKLTENGFHAYAHDHRGHGANIGARHPRGMFGPRDGYQLAIGDVAAVNAHIHAVHPGLPVIIFGHSMGGLIALNYVLDHAKTVQGAAIWNANVSSTLERRNTLALLYMERMLKGSDVPSALLPKLTFRSWGHAIANHRTMFDWLSHDEAQVDAYIADPMCGFDPSVSMWIDIFRMMERGADDRVFKSIRKDFAFNLVGGAQDAATQNGKAMRKLGHRLTSMGFTKIVSKTYPETRHESLNEINHQIITEDFIDWLQAF